jgi:uncharacterized protein YutE (UPF0331/DUF86 family)
MENDIILRKMDSLRRCLIRIEEKKPDDWTAIDEDYDLQDILTINLERSVQISVDIGLQIFVMLSLHPPSTMADVFKFLAEEKIISNTLAENLKKAVGFRNIAVHEYEEINWSIVQSICTQHLDDFYRYIKAILDYEPAAM